MILQYLWRIDINGGCMQAGGENIIRNITKEEDIIYNMYKKLFHIKHEI